MVYVGNEQKKGAKKARVDAKAHLTVLFTILPNGKFLNPYVLYPYERVPAEIRNSFPDGISYGKSPNGWMVTESFLHYLQTVVVSYLNTENVERPFILFVDGHSSHLSLEVIEFCKEQEIVLITLYPNATWLMQPLDVGVFAQFKGIWDAFLMEKDSDFTFVMNNRTFALALKEFMDLKSETLEPYVKASFRDCGIYPWNVNAIKFENMLETCRMRTDEAQKVLEDETIHRYGFVDNPDSKFLYLQL